MAAFGTLTQFANGDGTVTLNNVAPGALVIATTALDAGGSPYDLICATERLRQILDPAPTFAGGTTFSVDLAYIAEAAGGTITVTSAAGTFLSLTEFGGPGRLIGRGVAAGGTATQGSATGLTAGFPIPLSSPQSDGLLRFGYTGRLATTLSEAGGLVLIQSWTGSMAHLTAYQLMRATGGLHEVKFTYSTSAQFVVAGALFAPMTRTPIASRNPTQMPVWAGV